MKRLFALPLMLILLAGCGQTEEPMAANETPAAPPAASQAEPIANEPSSPEPAPQAAAAAPQTPTSGNVQLAQVDLGPVEAAGFFEGQHYRRISPAQPTNTSPGQVEVAEFFMHSCIHCFNLEPYLEAWLEDKPDYINFVRVPVTWDAYRQLHAAAYYVAESLGIEEEIHLPFFREIHDNNNLLDSGQKLADFFGRFDVSEDEFESLISSFAIVTKVNRANELQNRYRIQSTPTIVINGKYSTGVDMAGSYDRLFELIEALAAAELGG